MRKIIFLDVDGVVWTGNHSRLIMTYDNDAYSRMNEFCPKAVSQLNRILLTDKSIAIIISSSWRVGHSLQWLKDHFESNGVDPDRIIGKTPLLIKSIRGLEIQQWLDHQVIMSDYWVKGYVIIDDDSDMGNLKHKLVKTNFYSGLTKEKADEAIKILNSGGEK